MWKWILKIAVALGQSKWAREKAKKIIGKGLDKANKKAEELAATAGVSVPVAAPVAKKSTIIRTKTECFKPGQFVYVEGSTLMITKLLSASAREVMYEAVAV